MLIGERMEVRPTVGIDPHKVYHFVYTLFCALPYLATKINSFDDLNTNTHFRKSTVGVV